MMSISNKAKVILPNDKTFHKQVEETTHKIFSSISFFYKWISSEELSAIGITDEELISFGITDTKPISLRGD